MNNEDVIIAALRALPSDNMRKEEMFAVESVLRMAIDLVAGGATANTPLEEQLHYARGTIIELSRERATLNRDCFNLSIELDAERKRVAELDAALVTERDLVSRLTEENARIKRGDMFERGEMASEPAREFVVYAPKKDKPSGWGDIPHEVAL